MRHLFLTGAFCASALPALADEPVVEAVTAHQSGGGWTFSVTLSHPDTGWDHYADGWRVLDMDGNELGLRVLAHPHEQEQPFTRSLSRVQLPEGATQVQIQARCLTDGWSKAVYTYTLP
ncbi:hypothetical protein [Leisingera daeponensis]|uniref:hypothetical protein n=1 Tax=Leisingera daeponensis TaxID=405746 RepID=UPI001C9875B0|nr:hypothetical protein [Leisingera daeponensis]MBY6055983.1 hypothetical protein [Leisingera daeponensis]